MDTKELQQKIDDAYKVGEKELSLKWEGEVIFDRDIDIKGLLIDFNQSVFRFPKSSKRGTGFVDSTRVDGKSTGGIFNSIQIGKK